MVDQVPHPIVIGLDDTRDTQGGYVPVCMSRLGAGADKIFCSIQTCFRQQGRQPKIVVICRGNDK